ncbi:hypothetical protein [Alkalimarinus sediminis]|uniref:Uncharacterized protein n=1 Tax=Alkalimarinus sediminis TaxID=1632866 RepID=A0A9E8HIE4_9ALTE|nr:hypothetical protein [Alkalimarinus sediminis]UZW73278.1 hypothetical protein NNL22_09450 [Alkalimarinus sediminis]
MDKLKQDMDDQTLLEEIPLLKDIVIEHDDGQTNSTTQTTAKQQTQPEQKPKPLDDSKANPFLPYEHLAKLALERERFTQSIEAFTENLKQEKRYQEKPLDPQNNYNPHKNDAIVQAITNRVLSQLKPVIEEKIAVELNLYFDDILREE